MNMKPGSLMPPFEGRVIEDVLAARSSDPDAFDAWRIKDEDVTRVIDEKVLPIAREWAAAADKVLKHIPLHKRQPCAVNMYCAFLTNDRHLERDSHLQIPEDSQKEYRDCLVVIDRVQPSQSCFLERLFPVVSYSQDGKALAALCGDSKNTMGRMIPVTLLRDLITAMQQEDGKRPLYVKLSPDRLIYGETGNVPEVEKIKSWGRYRGYRESSLGY